MICFGAVDHACRVLKKIKPTRERAAYHQQTVTRVFNLIAGSEQSPSQEVWGAAFRLLNSCPQVDMGWDELYRKHKEANTPLYQEVVRETRELLAKL